MGVKNFGKYKNEYEDCMKYHQHLLNNLSRYLLSDLVILLIKY